MPKKKILDNNLRNLDASTFYSDCEKEGLLYSKLIRSPAKMGIIKDVVLQDIPEGYYLYTAKDIPSNKTIHYNNTELKIFGYDKIGYQGEPLGILIGPSERTLCELLEKVDTQYETETLESALTKVMDIAPIEKDEIKQNNQPSNKKSDILDVVDQLNKLPSLNDVIDNTPSETQTEDSSIIAKRIIKFGLYENTSEEEADAQLFSENIKIIEGNWSSSSPKMPWTETSGAFGYYKNNQLHIFAPIKWTYFLQNSLSEVLNISLEQIFIHKTKNPIGSSNGLWRTTQIAIQVAIATFVSKKPVMLQLSHSEQKAYMSSDVKTTFSYKTSINENGIIETLKITIDSDIGLCNPFAQEVIDRLSIASCGMYKPKNLYISAIAHTSQNPPTSISLTYIDSQSFFAIENQIQKISEMLHIFSGDIRINNTTSQTFPFTTPLGNFYDTLSTAIKISDFNRKYVSFHTDALNRVKEDSNLFFAIPLRGIGLASTYNSSGFFAESTFTYDSKIEVTLFQDEKVVIHSLRPSAPIQEIWKKTVSELLKIPTENIKIDSNFLINELPRLPEDTIGNISIVNEVLKKCCNDIQKRRFHQPLPLTSKKGLSPSSKRNWKNDTFTGNPYYSLSYATAIVEVELDINTFNEKIKGIWLTIDCGEVLDETAAINSIKLDIQRELSSLVSGKTLTCDNMKIILIKSKNKSGQLNKIVHNTIPAAFSSALSVALATQLEEIPCNENLLFKLIKER
jgi:CO/xanthine dehydrogenase Mo-binding subunit